MDCENSQPHVIIFPLMAQGHTLPLLDLAKVLSRRGIKVTILTTPSNVPNISSIVTDFKSISTRVLPFPLVEGLPKGLENIKDITSLDEARSFITALLLLKEPFECCLREIIEKEGYPICLISNYLAGRWTVPLCSSFNIPTLLCYTFGVLTSALCNLVCLSEERFKSLSNEEKFETINGFTCPFPLSLKDFPEFRDENNPLTKFLKEYGDGGASKNCWGILCNSFEELEGEFVGALESSCGKGVKAWCVGPFFLYDQEENKPSLKEGYLQDCSNSSNLTRLYQSWLDEKLLKQEMVIYIAFGTQSHLSHKQLDEIAFGLDMAGYPFIWINTSTTWTSPDGWEERVKCKGLVIRELLDQKSLLKHPAVFGFLSHCGWNSTLESLSLGVPILAMPLGAEQPLNAKLVVHVLKAGITIEQNIEESINEEVTFGCNAISVGVKELMGGERGKLARQRAKEIGRMARNVVGNEGTSSKKLDNLIINCLMDLKVNRQISN